MEQKTQHVATVEDIEQFADIPEWAKQVLESNNAIIEANKKAIETNNEVITAIKEYISGIPYV